MTRDMFRVCKSSAQHTHTHTPPLSPMLALQTEADLAAASHQYQTITNTFHRYAHTNNHEEGWQYINREKRGFLKYTI